MSASNPEELSRLFAERGSAGDLREGLRLRRRDPASGLEDARGRRRDHARLGWHDADGHRIPSPGS
jgi:hypothetical protein